MSESSWHPWSRLAMRERTAWLARFQTLCAKRRGALCEAVSEDTGKPGFEALMGDVAPFLAACRWNRRHAERLLGPRRVGGEPWWMRGVRMIERRAPLGRVAIIATWNYPVQTLGVQLIQALVAGNTVVVKPSERAARSGRLLIELAEEAGLMPGAVRATAATREAGEALLASERFDHIVFTGSTEVGRAVARRAAETLTPATLELSGADSAFVLEDADPKLAAEVLWAAVCMNAGQTCLGPRRALVDERVYKAFVENLGRLAKVAAAKPLIDESAARRCYEEVIDAVRMGGRDAAEAPFGSPVPPSPVPQPLGRMWRPTAVIDCPAASKLAEGRHFGPALAVVRVKGLEEALEVHERGAQHLTASVFTASVRRAEKLAGMLGVTNVTVNDAVVPIAHPAVSIGGRGESGVGLSRGEEGLLSMTRPVYVSWSKGLARRALGEPPALVKRIMSWAIGIGYRW